ncbi:MAG TPA: DUF4153 domain-containing protein [Allosphingosinicella sp.]|jgi:hypothetical protein|uniref:DUF4153 domain-containing protein n=1 Tax=Allosphingosinicella sp. TaxID=2823234 RepID=UPI002F289453
MSDKAGAHEAWPARAAGLALLGALLAITFERLLLEGPGETATNDPLRLSLASFVAIFGFVLGFTLERFRPLWSALFALGCASVVALIFYWNGTPEGWSAGDEWRVFSALLVVAIAAPLFQTMRDAGARRLDPSAVHAHAWTNIVLWAAAWAFTLITFLLAHLLAELFNLIGIDLLRRAMREGWFVAGIIGAALGGAIGLLRDRDKVLGNLQRVVTTVLSVLAPVLAVGLVLFVAALPFTGLTPLWDKTSATTPILLLAIAGALVLANAVIGNSAEEEAKGRLLRLSAMALGAVMLPLAIVAAISTWLRIEQHGLTPERLWAAVFVTVVLAIAGTYLWTVARGRLGWSERARPANVKLALAISAVALVLATPLVNFGAIATRDQLARLEAGRITPDRFDWAALRFDFGPSGREALTRLSRSGPDVWQAQARQALAIEDRWAARETMRVGQQARDLAGTVRVIPSQMPLPTALVDAVARERVCSVGPCTIAWDRGAPTAVAVGLPCESCQAVASRFEFDGRGAWQRVQGTGDIVTGKPASAQQQRQALDRGQVEIRTVQRQQVYLGGEPVGTAFE